MLRKMTVSVPRSDDMIVVGYFLARLTILDRKGRPKPPDSLSCSTWTAAYDLFFAALADGRTPQQFRHSLRNTRDIFDPLFDNGRAGWSDGQKRGQALSPRDVMTHQYWAQRDDAELAGYVAHLVG